MSRRRKDPLRPLTADERQELIRLSRSPAAPAVAGDNGTVSMPLLTRRVDPKEFGIQDETATTIAAVSFLPDSDDVGFGPPAFFTSASLGRFCAEPNNDVHYYATTQRPLDAQRGLQQSLGRLNALEPSGPSPQSW